MKKSSFFIKLFLSIITVIVIYGSPNQKTQIQQKNKMQNQSTADKILSDTLFFTPSFAKNIKKLASMSPQFVFGIPDKDQPNIKDIIKKYGKADKQIKISRDEFFMQAPRGVNDRVEIFLFYQYGSLGFAMPVDEPEQKVKYIRWKKSETK
ncbi:MAG: hypothetical protein NTZ27_12065 [Ignavibacteriales bacterium]|nr:hypothetical protein [Ignavibacteriales bacterium]